MQLVLWSAGYLEDKGVESPRLDAEHLLAHALGVDRLQLYLQHDRPLTDEELAAFKPLLLRRGRREPLQYIVGSTGFRELELRTDRRGLVPRPETEVLVDHVLAWARATEGPAERALDVGTGSGAIALSLVTEGPFRVVVASDVDAEALSLARDNARALGVEDRLEFRLGDGFEVAAEGERFDVVVSNPPYVAPEEAPGLAPEVREHEPARALYAEQGGLAVLLGLVQDGWRYLRPEGLLALEVGAGQAGRVADAARSCGHYEAVRVEQDLNGRDRVVLACAGPGAGGV